jgi:hypothetical protein
MPFTMETSTEATSDLLQQTPSLNVLQDAIREYFPGCQQGTKNKFVSDLLETKCGTKFRVLDLNAPRSDLSLPAGVFLQTCFEYLPNLRVDPVPALAKELSEKMAEQLSKTRIIEGDLQLTPFTYSKIHHFLVFSVTIKPQEQDTS